MMAKAAQHIREQSLIISKRCMSIKIAASKTRIDIQDPARARQEEANADEPEEESESEEHRAIVFFVTIMLTNGFHQHVST